MTREDIKLRLEELLSPKRYIHSLGVMNTASDLARRYGEDREKAALAGILHDCARDIRGEELFKKCERYGVAVDPISQAQPELLHGPLGAILAREEFEIDDEEILQSIKYHTTGCENMSPLDKIVFIADCIEPNRNYPGLEELRKAAGSDIDNAMLLALEKTVRHVLSKGTLIHPDTINARNYLILRHLSEKGKYLKRKDQ